MIPGSSPLHTRVLRGRKWPLTRSGPKGLDWGPSAKWPSIFPKMPAWQVSMPCHSHRHKNKMCVAKECSKSIMAAAKDHDNQETTDQEEPGSTCPE